MTDAARSIGLSLWIQPSGQLYDRMASIIRQLSERFHTPIFEPHVTLLGDLVGDEQEITAQAQQLAAQIPPFQMTLTTVDYLEPYFRCLFVRAQETPELLRANQIARSIFHREQDPKFMPHMSLLYGTFDVAIKKQIIQTIGHEFNAPFAVNSIQFLSCNGTPQEWYKIKELVLH